MAIKPTRTKKMAKYVPPKSSPLPADYDEFMASLNKQEKELFEIAKEKLGSSFFVQWTHLYRKWSQNKAAAAKQAPVTKN
jgi:hypothetical protein